MSLKFIENATERMRQIYPKTFKAVYPRNIVVPKGYTDPAFYGTIMTGHLQVALDFAMNELAHRTAYGTALVLIANKVPTYFVADEFAQAVANTDLPGDFKFVELKWPMEAQLFVLSDQFVQSYYGHHVPFLMVGRIKEGTYPRDFNKTIPQGETPYPLLIVKPERIVMDYPYFGTELPVTYNASYPMTDDIQIFKNAPWNDATVFEKAFEGNLGPQKGELTREQEDALTQKAQQFAIKLLLTVAGLSGCREHGCVTRHAIVTQQGKTKLPELVSANMIGRTYRIPRKYGTMIGGATRAKPRFKYRRGHYAWQAHRLKNMEFVSVEEMPHKLDGFIDFNAAGSEKSEKFRGCHERLWIEGFFFDEEDGDKPVPSTDGAKPD